jgi:beta-glucanase (GH16 family)
VNSSIWVHDVGIGPNGDGWGNNEAQCYTAGTANTKHMGTYLQIQARAQAGCNGKAYTSGRIKTQGKSKQFKMGQKLEGVMRSGIGVATWPAFWTLGENITSIAWPACGEIDVMEHVNSDPKAPGTIHWDNGGYVYYTATNPGQPNVTLTNWNTFTVEWTTTLLRWKTNGAYVGDANIAGSVNGTDEFQANKPFFVILNYAIGGNWPGQPTTATPTTTNFEIDWVKVSALP